MVLATFILLLKRSAPFRRKPPALTSSTISETGDQNGTALPTVGVAHQHERSRPTSAGAAVEGTGSTVAVDAFPPPLTEKLPDGEHTVDFPDGTRYSGQWTDGKMNGRGVLRWPSGDHYEGAWVNGLQQGQGTFAASDGSMYFGGWKNGQMEGLGVFKPAPPASMVYLRSYENGIVIKETSLRVEAKEGKRKKQLKESKKRSSGLQQRPLQPGEVIYKGHHSYDLMRQLQVGIMYSIAQAGQWKGHTRLSSSDFSAESVQYFPSGSAAEASAFKWKDYAPRVFQCLRQLFGIDSADYLVSLTGGPALRELASPGASGCIFFLSSDDRFMIKSVRKEEMVLLLDLVRQYHGHVAAQPGTLLVRFYGVHRISPWLGKNARFLVMGNVLPTDKRMHRKYDLKGSSYKRTVGEEKRKNNQNATLKDLDIDVKFELSPERRAALLAQIKADAAFLESLHVMDYSLLLGVHFVNWGDAEWYPPFENWPESEQSPLSPFLSPMMQSPTTNLVEPTTTQNCGTTNFESSPGNGDSLPPLGESTTRGSESKSSAQGMSKKPSRTGSMAAGQSLVETLESLSVAGMLEPGLSATAASVVACANNSGLAARATAKALATSSEGQVVSLHPWLEDDHRHHQVPDLTNTSSVALMEATTNTSAAAASDRRNGDVFDASSAAVTGGGGGGGASNDTTANVPNDSTNLSAGTAASSYYKKISKSGSLEGSRGSGWAVPAVAVRRSPSGEIVGREPVLLYFGIIDFLQHYNARKWVEHAWKKTLHGNSVSVADPHHYAKRFVNFLDQIFVPMEMGAVQVILPQ